MPEEKSWRDDPLYAYAGPFIMFMAGLALVGFFKQKTGTIFQTHPEFWIYPLQTIVCAVGLGIWWKHYNFRPLDGKSLGVGVVAGLVVLGLWIALRPLLGVYSEQFFNAVGGLWGSKPETLKPDDGFNPTLLAGDPALYYGSIVMRLVRIAVVVPFLEELFWRAFLMRFFLAGEKEEFTDVPFGTFAVRSFVGVAIAFAFVHLPIDRPAAVLCGLIYGGVAVYTRSLGACVIAHAVTNLLLGIYVLKTQQWSFW